MTQKSKNVVANFVADVSCCLNSYPQVHKSENIIFYKFLLSVVIGNSRNISVATNYGRLVDSNSNSIC